MISLATDIVMTSAMLLNLPQAAGALQAACAEAGVPEPFVIAPPKLSDLPPTFPKIFQPPARVQREISLTLGAAGQSPPHAAPKTAASAGAGGGSPPPPRDSLPLDSAMIVRIGHLLKNLAESGARVTVATELETIGDEFVGERPDYAARCYQGAYVWLMEREMCGETIDARQREWLREKLGRLPTVEISSLMTGIPGTALPAFAEAGLSQHARMILSPPPRPRLVGLPPSLFGLETPASSPLASSPSLEAIDLLAIELARYKRVGEIPGLVGRKGELLLASWQEDTGGQIRLARKVSTIHRVRFMAAGGMGLVFVGEETTGTVSGSRDVPPLPVVLKTLPIQLASDERLRNRFFLEEWVATFLRHRNILTVRGLEWTQDGRPIMLLPYQRGWVGNPAVKDLESLLKLLSPLDIHFAVEEIFLPVVDAVAYAHEMGVIHRDLKPANIFIDQEGERPVFRVSDFGLAYLVNSPRLNYDAPGMVPGTPSYMSLDAQMGRPSKTTDVFALGVMMYETLANIRPIGTTPSRGEPTTQADVWLPQVQSMRLRRPEVPFELERIVLRAMGYTPQQQSGQFGLPLDAKAFPFKTASELFAVLHQYNEARKAGDEAKADIAAAARLEVEAEERCQPEMKFAAFEVWRRKMEEAIARWDVALGKLKGHNKSLVERRWNLLWQLFKESERFGEEELVLPRLAHHPDYSRKAQEPGRLLVSLANPHQRGVIVDVVTYKNEEGVFREWKSERFDRLDTLPKTWPKGIYLLRISGGEVAPIQIPFLIGRGEKTELKFRLYAQSEVPEGFAVVPAGEVITDAEPHFYGSKPQGKVGVPSDFFVKETLVTNEEYIRFLNDLISLVSIEEVLSRLPRDSRGQPLWHAETVEAIRRGEFIGDEIYYATAGSGERAKPVDRHAPVIWISTEDAQAWSDWNSTPENPLSLPTRNELLYLMRGNDSRKRPWGDALLPPGAANVKRPRHDPSLSEEEVDVTPVGQFPLDASPFGAKIRDLFGNAREFTADSVTLADGNRFFFSMGSGFSLYGDSNLVVADPFFPNRPLPHGFRAVIRKNQ